MSLLVQLIIATQKSDRRSLQQPNLSPDVDTPSTKGKVSAGILKFDLLCLALGLLTNLMESYKGDGCDRFINISKRSLCGSCECSNGFSQHMRKPALVQRLVYQFALVKKHSSQPCMCLPTCSSIIFQQPLYTRAPMTTLSDLMCAFY